MISNVQNQRRMDHAIFCLASLLFFAFCNTTPLQTGELTYNLKLNQPFSSSWSETTIYINEAGANDWASTAATYDWCSGSGTFADPYIIQNVSVYNPVGYAIRIINSQGIYFKIQNCSAQELQNSAFYAGITISDSNNGQIIGNNLSSNLGSGIYFDNCDNMTVSNNILNNNGFHGILLNGLSASCDYNTISGNSMVNNSILAIYLNFNNSNNLIVNNEINGAGEQLDGIALSNYGVNNTLLNNNFYDLLRIGINCGYQGSSNSHNMTMIQGNTFVRCSRGVYLETNGNQNQIFENIFDQISLVGVWISGDTASALYNSLIRGNSFTNCRTAIIAERYTTNSLIEGNIIQNSSSCGVNLYTLSSNNTVCNNEISLSKVGIWLQYSDVAHPIFNNTICDSSEYGIYGLQCSSQIFADNYLTHNNLSAIYLASATDNVITGNILSHNLHDAISVEFGEENIISGNKIMQSGRYGILLNQSVRDRVVANMVYDNLATGIFLNSCQDTIVHDNLLGGNDDCIDFEGCTGLHVYNNTCLLDDNADLSATSLLDALSNPEGWIIGGAGLVIGAIIVAIIRGGGKKKPKKKKKTK